MKTLKWIFIALTATFISTVLVTWLALERSSVIQLETTRHQIEEDGRTQRVTRAWFVEHKEELLLEAGHPNNPWVLDIDKTPQLRILSSGARTAQSPNVLEGLYCTDKDTSPAGHREIRSLMRAKYGWRDQWVDALFDVSHSALVRLRRC